MKKEDFDSLYNAASDSAIWAQHPDADRWKKEAFSAYFDLAIKSGGAFKIVNKATNEVVGSTRFYNYDDQAKSIFIDYTFYTTACWGTGTNPLVKKTMLDYIFDYVSKVYFHIGIDNIRSQKAIEAFGADKVGEQIVSYHEGTSRQNYLYEVLKEKWTN